ncbi:MAG TPA: site-2 protease family protein [Kofleriaceae bacterium]|jgi:Zn-dependent protease|nr:site-2 protease family protein [Kofleriaceae bacterium]
MFKRWRLGTLLGFPVEVNLSFLLMLGVVFLWLGGAAGLFVVGMAFGSVLLHELGHALVARSLGVPVSGIELHFFGGAAKMVAMPKKANHEVAIAAAGPAVSLMLAGLGLGLGFALHAPIVALFGWINLVIAGFNLIPALPMDGGRILRALLTRKMSFVRATDVSVKVARVVAVAFLIAGLMGSVQLLLLAPILWVMGTQEQLLARHIESRYAYDHGGYTQRRADEPQVVRAAGPRRFVIRDRRGGWVIDVD